MEARGAETQELNNVIISYIVFLFIILIIRNYFNKISRPKYIFLFTFPVISISLSASLQCVLHLQKNKQMWCRCLWSTTSDGFFHTKYHFECINGNEKKKKSHFCFEMHCEYCTSKKKNTKANNAEVFSPYCYDPLQQMCLLAPLLKVDFRILLSPVFCVFYFLCSVHL